MRAFQTRRSVRVLPAWLQGLRTRSLATWALLLLVAACGGGNTDAVGVSGTTYTVSATITGLRHSYNGGTLRNNGGDDLKIFNNGSYSFKTALASGSPYAVTVSLQPTGPDQTCTVSNGSGTVGTSNVTNVAIDCPYAAAYSVGGTVTGLVGTGLNLIYDADNVSLRPMATMNADGSFVFDASFTNAINGTVYQVSIVNQPTNPAQTCVVQNGSGTVANADVTGVNVVCGTHTVSLWDSSGTQLGTATSRLPARPCSMSMFCVTTAWTKPSRSSSASARCAAFGSASRSIPRRGP